MLLQVISNSDYFSFDNSVNKKPGYYNFTVYISMATSKNCYALTKEPSCECHNVTNKDHFSRGELEDGVYHS